MGVEDYPSQKIESASQYQLEEMLSQFRKKQISFFKLGVFLTYNAVALTGLAAFAKHYVSSRWNQRVKSRKQLSLKNLVKKGSIYGAMMSGVYMTGFIASLYYFMPLPIFYKHCEIQQALQSFSFKFDPNCMDLLLFTQMKAFGISDQLIQQTKDELQHKKSIMIKQKALKPQTIKLIQQAEQQFKKSQKQQE